MLRLYWNWIGFAVLALFFTACSCGDSDDDAGFSDCPSEPPEQGTPCSVDLLCTYEPWVGCHADCTGGCPPGCTRNTGEYASPCSPSQYRCENGSWRRTQDSVPEACRPFDCLCPDAGGGGLGGLGGAGGSGGTDAGPDSSHRDSSTDDDAGN